MLMGVPAVQVTGFFPNDRAVLFVVQSISGFRISIAITIAVENFPDQSRSGFCFSIDP